MTSPRILAWVAMSAACGGGGGSKKTLDAAALSFQGEYVDWDSSASAFCGIDMASYNAAGSSASTPTPPNGRLMLTMPAGVTQIDLTPPDAASQCAPGSGTYDNPGVISIDPALVTADVTYSTRSFTTDRRASLFSSLGLTYDPTKAMVLINVQGTATNPVIGASHDASAAYDGTTWGSGATGVYVFFPNVDTTDSNTLLTATGYAGSAEIPIAAATFTYAAVSSM